MAPRITYNNYDNDFNYDILESTLILEDHELIGLDDMNENLLYPIYQPHNYNNLDVSFISKIHNELDDKIDNFTHIESILIITIETIILIIYQNINQYI